MTLTLNRPWFNICTAHRIILDMCAKLFVNPTSKNIERIRKTWQTDRQTDGRTDGQTDWRTDGRTSGRTDGLQSSKQCFPILSGGKDINIKNLHTHNVLYYNYASHWVPEGAISKYNNSTIGTLWYEFDSKQLIYFFVLTYTKFFK